MVKNMKDIKLYKKILSKLSDEERHNKLMEIFYDLRKEIRIKEGKCNDDELISMITRHLGTYNDYLSMSVALMLKTKRVKGYLK